MLNSTEVIKDWCSYTYYKQQTTGVNTLTQGWTDQKYHPNWQYIRGSATTETHGGLTGINSFKCRVYTGKCGDINSGTTLNSDPLSLTYGKCLGTTVTVTASKPTVTAKGQKVTIKWESTNATSCSASGAWTGALDKNGSQEVTVNNFTNEYKVTCQGSSGSAVSSVIVTRPPLVTLTNSGKNFAWSLSNVSSCTSTGGESGTNTKKTTWDPAKSYSSATNGAIAGVCSSPTIVMTCIGPAGTATATATVPSYYCGISG